MRAAILKQYRKNGIQLDIEEIPVPSPSSREVLVRIVASGVNPLDNMIARGEVKLITPYKLPLIMGNEFAGEVIQIGEEISRFKPGDRVYGRMPLNKTGAFAEFVSIQEDAIATIPSYLTYEEAASVPLTALTAMQAFELMGVKSGESVFISGGTGSFGAMAIPLAKRLGLRVYTSGSEENKERVLALGAEEFIDYRKYSYVDKLSNLDYVIDTLGDRELPNQFKILKERGHLVSLRGLPNGRFAKRMGLPLLTQYLFKIAGSKYDWMAGRKKQIYDFLFVQEDGRQLDRFGSLFPQNTPLETSVDKIFELDQINEALQKIEEGRSKGKTVIQVRG